NTSVSTNSTAVAGGGISTSGTVSLNNATVVFNTSAGEAGGISQTDGTVTVSNTILAANTAPAGAECKGTLASAGYNLVGDPDGCTIGGDGVVEPAPDATGEECDGGGCCSPTCVSLPAGHGCMDDADLCTEDRCDDGGACRHFVNGYAGVDCELAELLQPGICGGDAP